MSDLIFKDDGTPFATYNSAKAKRTRMGVEGLDTNIVEVDNGFALQKKPYNPPRKRIPLGQRNVLTVPEDELEKRRAAFLRAGGYEVPESQTPWQEIFRVNADQLSQGMVLKPAVKYQRVAQKFVPRDSH